MPRDLRQFIDELREEHPDDVVDVWPQVDPARHDVSAILQHLDDRKRYPLTLFQRASDMHGEESAFKLVSNVFGTRERCADALGWPREKAGMPLSLEFARLEREQLPSELVDRGQAPVKEVVRRGDEVDVGVLPIVNHYELDLGPVLTMGQVMRARDGSFYDVSFAKNFYLDNPRRMTCSIHSPHLERVLAEYEKHDEPAPIVNILGHHPAFFLGSLALAPWANDDYATIGGFMREPVRLVASETWGEEFLVPADAEILIEGEIPPGEREIADPFGEVTRHYQAQCLRPVFNVQAMTHRREALLQDIFSGHQGHWNLGGIPKEGSIFNALQRRFGIIRAVHLPYSACARLACYVSIHKSREGQAKEVGLAALTESWTLQSVVVVDQDIDPFNEQDVLWAFHTNVDPARDLDFLKNVGNSVFTTAWQRQKLVIDATRPLDVAFPQMFRVPPDAMDRIKLEEWIG